MFFFQNHKQKHILHNEENTFCQRNSYFLLSLGCTKNVNKPFGKLDISYTSKFVPYCNWMIGHAGISQAVAIVYIHQINFNEYNRYKCFLAPLLSSYFLNPALLNGSLNGLVNYKVWFSLVTES